jgi:hypothetical protein
MTNQDESNNARTGMEGSKYIDNTGKDDHPDLGMSDETLTNSEQTRLDDNDSQASFENDEVSGKDVHEEDDTSNQEVTVD